MGIEIFLIGFVGGIVGSVVMSVIGFGVKKQNPIKKKRLHRI